MFPTSADSPAPGSQVEKHLDEAMAVVSPTQEEKQVDWPRICPLIAHLDPCLVFQEPSKVDGNDASVHIHVIYIYDIYIYIYHIYNCIQST